MTHPALHNRVAIVTGGTRGLGLAITRRFRNLGCHVVVNHVRQDLAAEQATAAMAGLPGSSTVVRGDAREPETVQTLVDTAVERYGRLDIFVHNAATLTAMSALAPDVDAVHAELALALNPLLAGAALFRKAMTENGRVIAISSNGSSRVIRGYLATGVAKAALESLVRYLAVELATWGISVNAVATALLDKDADNGMASPDAARLLAARTPGGHLTLPDDVADAVALLCGDDAAWIHGQVITVDGGLGLWG
jgi:enoyl-[acyl-carrier protein] reductase III